MDSRDSKLFFKSFIQLPHICKFANACVFLTIFQTLFTLNCSIPSLNVSVASTFHTFLKKLYCHQFSCSFNKKMALKALILVLLESMGKRPIGFWEVGSGFK